MVVTASLISLFVVIELDISLLFRRCGDVKGEEKLMIFFIFYKVLIDHSI